MANKREHKGIELVLQGKVDPVRSEQDPKMHYMVRYCHLKNLQKVVEDFISALTETLPNVVDTILQVLKEQVTLTKYKEFELRDNYAV